MGVGGAKHAERAVAGTRCIGKVHRLLRQMLGVIEFYILLIVEDDA